MYYTCNTLILLYTPYMIKEIKTGRPRKQEQIDAIGALREQGMSYNQISRAMSIHKARVQYVVQNYL